MIGEDQTKGYKEEFEPEEAPEAKEKTQEEKEKDAFEKRKKAALRSIGRTDDGREEAQELSDEQVHAIADKAMSQDKMQKQKSDSMAHDLIILRAQMNEMVKVLNKLQTGFVSKLNDLERHIDDKLANHLQQIEAKINKLNR